MQLRHLRYFVKIVEVGSFSRAATTIHVAQPALSQQIAELETELGVPLLHRGARGVHPTAAGEALHREAIAILRLVEQLPGRVRATGGEVSGVVNLGMASTLAAFLSAPFIDACRAAYPEIALRFTAAPSLSGVARTQARTIDLAVIFEDGDMPSFQRQKLFTQRLFAVRRRPIAPVTSLSLEELAARPLILPASPNTSRGAIDRAFARLGVVPKVAAEVDALHDVLSAVRTGIGDAILPKGDFSDIPGHESIVASALEPAIRLTVSIIAAADLPLTRAAEAVRDLLVAFVARILAENPPPGAEPIALPQP